VACADDSESAGTREDGTDAGAPAVAGSSEAGSQATRAGGVGGAAAQPPVAGAGPAAGGSPSAGAGPAVGGSPSAGAGPAAGGSPMAGAGPAAGGSLSAGAGPAAGGSLSAGAGPAAGGSPTAGAGPEAGGSSGATGGSSSQGGSAGAAGGAPSGGSAGYEPCAGRACGDPCSPCAPDDPDCVPVAVVTVCDADGRCVPETSGLCEGVLWAETDAAEYRMDEQGTATLHNDTQAVVYLPGCESYYYELQVGGEWIDQGPEHVACTWEGYARPVPAGTTFDSTFGPFTDMEAGTWRIRFTVGHDCQEDSPLSQAECTSMQDVFTPPFVVDSGLGCGDPATMARYDECAAATDADTCDRLGGTWEPLGLSPDPICQCPTGDGGCSCVRDSDCVTVCLAPTGAGGIDDCSGVTEGTCAARPTVGCWCLLEDSGQVSAICWD
jgi:hypothetical protein